VTLCTDVMNIRTQAAQPPPKLTFAERVRAAAAAQELKVQYLCPHITPHSLCGIAHSLCGIARAFVQSLLCTCLHGLLALHAKCTLFAPRPVLLALEEALKL
jgi:hypothetical protein